MVASHFEIIYIYIYIYIYLVCMGESKEQNITIFRMGRVVHFFFMSDSTFRSILPLTVVNRSVCHCYNCFGSHLMAVQLSAHVYIKYSTQGYVLR